MSFLQHLLAFAAFATLAITAPLKPRAPSCVDGVMIVAARGSDGSWTNVDAVNPNYADIGGMQTIADQIIAAVGGGSFLSAVPYPASGDFSRYSTSLGHGIDATHSIIKNYVDQCKATVNPRVVVLGYSQGANVVSDALVSGDGRGNLDSYKQYIVAGALFADPSFVTGVKPLDAGGAKHDGVNAKSTDLESYFNSNYGKKVRDYCQPGDQYCAARNWSNSGSIHGSSVGTFSRDALDFILPLVTK